MEQKEELNTIIEKHCQFCIFIVVSLLFNSILIFSLKCMELFYFLFSTMDKIYL